METTSQRVLIVDDMPVNRMILSSLLAANGVLSDKAQDGKECIALCKKNDYDLILLDHRMPEPDGVDTFMMLKELFDANGRRVPVICHTTEEGRKNINLYKAAGFTDVLIKPIEPGQLSDVLMKYLPQNGSAPQEDDKRIPKKTDHNSTMDFKDELDALPDWLKTVPHIDLVAGIENCESAEDYMDALYIFYQSIAENTEDIRRYYSNEEWTMYTLGVHSLKSMANLIGAKRLSAMAKALETAAKDEDFAMVRHDTDELLASYLQFEKHLSPIRDYEFEMPAINAEISEKKEKGTEPQHMMPILFVSSRQGIVTKGIEHNLKENGYNVISIPDEPDMLVVYRSEADIVVYYPESEDKSQITLTMNLLGEICRDDDKLLCVMGDAPDIETAAASNGGGRISRTYTRPVNMNRFMSDISFFAHLIEEFHRKKNIYIVDDDKGYLSVIQHWLSQDYTISCFDNGDAFLDGLGAMLPDMILLDYEMPELDGYDLLRVIRQDPETASIPVIFLTGKNDRDHVFKILEYKPDGYLLKTSQKQGISDAIYRFFSEEMFSRSKTKV